jgi:menaquinone-dependent protoporphyrinogen oxidase
MSEEKKVNRRGFLKALGLSAAGLVVVCSGVGVVATLPPSVDFVETSSAGAKKVLVAYASKAGSTGEVAAAIAEVLKSKGLGVDVKRISHVNDLSGYEGVILGSCIRIGAWLPEAVDFVKKHQTELGKMKTAFFTVSGTLREDDPETQKTVMAYLDPVRAVFEPGSIGLFGGKIDYSKLSLLDRTVAKGVGSVEGDWRNWKAIQAWAQQALSE